MLIHLCAIDVKPDPVELYAIETTATAISFVWNTSGAVDINSFEIVNNYTVKKCTSPEGANQRHNISNGTIRSYMLSGLNEDSMYRITVRAVNDVGSSMASISADTNTSSN